MGLILQYLMATIKIAPKPVIDGIRKLRQIGCVVLSWRLAGEVIRKIEDQTESPFKMQPRPGYRRGIDYYSSFDLKITLAYVIGRYALTHGYIPNLVDPISFNEKIVWSKLFGEFKVPESGNKFLTSFFIPENLAKELTCPKIIWHSFSPILPQNSEIPEGNYYLKPSHGSGMVERISYPLSPSQRYQLNKKAGHWLSSPYNLDLGEWWYDCFARQLLIEEQIGNEQNTVCFMFHTFHGEIHLISFYRKSLDGKFNDQSLWMDADFIPLTVQNDFAHPLEGDQAQLSKKTRDRLTVFASSIGRQFNYARIDFLLDEKERIFLNEITFAPSSGFMKWSKNLDLALGKLWQL